LNVDRQEYLQMVALDPLDGVTAGPQTPPGGIISQSAPWLKDLACCGYFLRANVMLQPPNQRLQMLYDNRYPPVTSSAAQAHCCC